MRINLTRVILTGLGIWFAFIVAAFIVMIILSNVLSGGVPPFFVDIVLAITGIGVLVLLLLLFAQAVINGYQEWSRRGKTQEDVMNDLRAKGLLVSETFRATRAFEVEEYGDEGPHYLVELDSGDVLYLGGQYLYEYTEIDDDPENNQPRRFPCTEFTVQRHKKEGYVLDIDCRGDVIEPEGLAVKFDWVSLLGARIPEPVEVLTGKRYDEIKGLAKRFQKTGDR